MKIRIMAMALLAAGILGLGLVASGCIVGLGGGGGDTLTLEEFFDELVALSDAQDTASTAIEDDFNALPDDAPVADVVDLLDQQIGVIEEFVDGIDDLNPPDEAMDIHDRAVTAGRAVVEQFQGAVDDARDAETVDDAFATFDNEEFNAAFDEFDAVCLEAQQLADDNNLDADLSCGE